MKFALIEAEKARFPIEFMCEELGVSRSGFYSWRQRKPSRRDREDVLLSVSTVRDGPALMLLDGFPVSVSHML